MYGDTVQQYMRRLEGIHTADGKLGVTYSKG